MLVTKSLFLKMVAGKKIILAQYPVKSAYDTDEDGPYYKAQILSMYLSNAI